MDTGALLASLKTFGKYLVWTGVALVIDWAAANLGLFHMPTFVVPLLAAFLKSAATYWATQKP